MTDKNIGPGSRVVCIRDWPWDDVYGNKISGPAYGSKWTVKECPIFHDGVSYSEIIRRSAPFLSLHGWPLEGDGERFFGVKYFRLIDPDRELDILRLIAKNVEKIPEWQKREEVEYVD